MSHKKGKIRKHSRCKGLSFVNPRNCLETESISQDSQIQWVLKSPGKVLQTHSSDQLVQKLLLEDTQASKFVKGFQDTAKPKIMDL